jgi:hypothetical protein
MTRTTQLKRLARHLLATTCLTAGTAMATTVTEPPSFGTTFATATALPAGTTMVEGGVTMTGGDLNDYFEFEGLVPGTGFDFTASTTSSGLSLNLLNSADAALPSSTDPYTFTTSLPASVDVTAPSDGIIVFDVVSPGGEGLRSYTIAVNTATFVPEPGTLGAMGLGLAAGAALTRRRKKKV